MQKIDERRVALCERVEAWALQLAVQTPRIRIQQMSRKWGSCSTLGTLTLAADLTEREAGFQDFVIVHELLHFRVPNHGKLFKTLMTAHVPDWREHDIAK